MKPPRPLVPVDATHVRDGGRVLWYAAGCNYLGWSHDRRLIAAIARSLEHDPIQPGASRATTGEHTAYLRTERTLARFLRQEAVVLLPTGYMAALSAMQGLSAHATHVVLHPAAHACLRDAARLSGLVPIVGWDGSAMGLRALRKAWRRGMRWVAALDGVAPARGDVADVPALLAALPPDGWLLIDDAHGIGTLGRRGRGVLEHHGVADDRVVLTGSLAKALGVAGGYVAGNRVVVESARRGDVHVGTTSPPLAMAAGVMAAMGLIREEPGRVRALQQRAAWLHGELHGLPGVHAHPASPVFAWIPGNALATRRLARNLRAAGIHPPFIRYPSGPHGSAEGFFRFAASALHEWEDLKRLVAVLRAN
jgi:7-keto-8-aminopelargonate synthetase-like enzyme